MPPVAVTGTLQTLTSGRIAQGKVIFQLTNIGTGNPVGVSGTSIIPALTYTVMTAQDGGFSVSLWGNDALTPANTLYAVTFRDFQGNELGPVLYSITGASANLNTLTASSGTVPPIILNNAVLLNPTAAQTISGFTLTDVTGFVSANFISTSSNPAVLGPIRLASADNVAWRNSGNTNDLIISSRAAVGNQPELILVQNQASPGTEGLMAGAFIQNGSSASVSATGALRLHSSDAVSWRNNANNSDLQLSKDTSDNLIWPGTSFAAFQFQHNGGSQALSGFMRLNNGDSISWRNNAASADVALAKNTNDSLTYGGFVMPQTVAVFNGGATASAIGTTTLYTTPAAGAGLYRLSYYLDVVIAGNAVNITGTFGWADDSGAAANALTTGNVSGGVLGSNSTLALGLGQVTFYAKASSAITYATALSASLGAGAYILRVRLEYLG